MERSSSSKEVNSAFFFSPNIQEIKISVKQLLMSALLAPNRDLNSVPDNNDIKVSLRFNCCEELLDEYKIFSRIAQDIERYRLIIIPNEIMKDKKMGEKVVSKSHGEAIMRFLQNPLIAYLDSAFAAQYTLAFVLNNEFTKKLTNPYNVICSFFFKKALTIDLRMLRPIALISIGQKRQSCNMLDIAFDKNYLNECIAERQKKSLKYNLEKELALKQCINVNFHFKYADLDTHIPTLDIYRTLSQGLS